MELVIGIFNFIFAVWTVVSISGYALYKYPAAKVDSWESGVKKVVSSGFTFLHKELSGKALPDEIVNTSLICTNDEALELVQRLNGHPYDTPMLVTYTPSLNGITWYDISAIRLIPSYTDLSSNEIAKICCHIIQSFFMETRGIQISIEIKVATSTRLYFAIPLSGAGRKFLEQQQTESNPNVPTQAPPEVMEEEIDIFGEEGQ